MKVWFNEEEYPGLEFFRKTDLVHQFEFLQPVFGFIDFWFSDIKIWQTKTSGSTGNPKLIEISKHQMEASAKASLHFFLLEKESDGLVLCLSATHVGGFMVLVRAIIGDLDLWILEPSIRPFPAHFSIIKKKNWFVSLVPMQIDCLTEDNGNSSSFLKGILLGGATISEAHKSSMNHLQCPVYQSYGMTETVSHVAIRKIYEPNKIIDIENEPYLVLPEIEIGQNDSNCLKVRGRVTNQTWIQTNDIVKMNEDKSFFFLGRADDIINSGGLKVNPVDLKTALEDIIDKELEFLILGIPNQKLGEKVVLVFLANQNPIFFTYEYWKEIFGQVAKLLDPRTLPKGVFALKHIPKTHTMKYDLPSLRSILENSKPIWEK